MDDALDRIVLGSFIPSDKWEGSKEGYYFRRDDQGVGYYKDATAPSDQKTTKRPRVQIAEEANQTRVILTADQLLQQAEDRAQNTRVVDLTVAGVKSCAK